MFDLSKFDNYREDNRREVKSAKHGLPVSLWDTYSTFANCYGGVIILGVKEKPDGSWHTTGLKDPAKLQKDFWDTINNHTKISINLLSDHHIEMFQKGEDTIMVIHVPAARREQKPVFINDDLFGGTFRRNWEGDYHCTREEVKAMLRDQAEDTSDMKVLTDFNISDLNMETVHAYRNRHNAYRSEHVWESLTDEEYLERIGAARISSDDRKHHPTAAGLLMFGEEYKILYEYPEYFLDYREMLDPSIRWTDRVQSSSGDWTGNDLISAVDFMKLSLLQTAANAVCGTIEDKKSFSTYATELIRLMKYTDRADITGHTRKEYEAIAAIYAELQKKRRHVDTTDLMVESIRLSASMLKFTIPHPW